MGGVIALKWIFRSQARLIDQIFGAFGASLGPKKTKIAPAAQIGTNWNNAAHMLMVRDGKSSWYL